MSASDRNFFSAFVSVSKAISSTLNLNKVLDLIVEHAVVFLDLKAGALSLWNKRENKLELIARIRYHSQAYIRLLQRNEAYNTIEESRKHLADQMEAAEKYVRKLLPAPNP